MILAEAARSGIADLRALCGRKTLCPLIMVGDPDIASTRALLRQCIAADIKMVELCVPFDNPFTDGPALQRAHRRALNAGATFEAALELIAEFAGRLAFVVLADASHTLRPAGFVNACRRARAAGAAALLPHGLPPRLRPEFDSAAAATIAVVGTVYVDRGKDIRSSALTGATAFVYAVAHYGRSGGPSAGADVARDLRLLRRLTDLPLALGFGLRTGADVTRAFARGADIAIVGSAISAAIESALDDGCDPVAAAAGLISRLQGAAS